MVSGRTLPIFSNTRQILRHYVSTRVGDLIYGQCGATDATVAKIHAPFLWQPNDYYNENFYEVYVYAGVNEGLTRRVTDWVLTTELLSVHSDYTAACDTTSYAELHRIFDAEEYNKAINLAIEHLARRYLIDIKDETKVLLRAESNENHGNEKWIYTLEYALPTSLLYVHKVILEHGVSGKRLWSTITTDFVVGETVTGDTSTATGIVSYQPTSDDFLMVREIDGDFEEDETLSGSTSGVGEAVSAIDGVNAGDGTFLEEDKIHEEDWEIVKANPAEIVFRKNDSSTVDRYIQIQGQGTQALLTSDSDVCYLPAEWIVSKAITLLPFNKIESANLAETFKVAERQARYEPYRAPYSRAKSVTE